MNVQLAEWDESQHPRADDGEFTDGGSGREPIGSPKHTTDVAARVKALRIPPAWKDVQLSVDPNAELQATGVDAKGRTQYLYSAEHSAKAAAAKFERLKQFNQKLPDLRKAIATDLHNMKLTPAEREAAAVMLTIDKTGFRIGGDERGGDKQAYGASTLEQRHVKVDGDKVAFRFVGKKGVDISKTVHDAQLASVIKEHMTGDRKARLFDVSQGDVRGYLHERAGDFNVKDLRTYHGTAKALETVNKMPVPKGDKALKKAQREVAKTVARHLGNTPAVALKSYIDPAVWSKWKKN